MKGQSILFLILTFLAISCSQTADLSFDTGRQQIVLNSILDATKDTIWAELSWSQAVNEVFELQPIDEALVVLSKNNERLDTFRFNGKGNYYLVHQPTVGDTFKVTAYVGIDSVYGITFIPPVPVVTMEYFVEEYCRHYEATLESNTNEQFNYWISAFDLKMAGDSVVEKNMVSSIDAEDIFLDEFNRTAGGNNCSFAYSYTYYLRLKNQDEKKLVTLSFHGGNFGNKKSKEIVVFAADFHYDRFIKSSILGSTSESLQSTVPLNLTPVVVYSNITGGIGLVGSINYVRFFFRKT